MMALQELAAAAGVELSPQNQKAYQSYTKKADILEAAHAYLQAILQEPETDREVFNYLADRGYLLDDMYDMELGAYKDRQALQECLQQLGYTEQEIKDTGLLTSGFGEDYHD